MQFFDDVKLENLMGLINKCLSKDGVFVFTFDICNKGYRMNKKLTMEHSTEYIDNKVRKHFNNVEVIEIPFGRFEKNKEVKCGLVVARRHLN